MLTCISNFVNFKDTKKFTDRELQLLYKNTILKDFINFDLDKVGGGFADYAEKLFEKVYDEANANSTFLLINDLSFQMYRFLEEDMGIPKSQIVLAFGNWQKWKNNVENDDSTEIMRQVAIHNFLEFKNDTSNIISLKEMFGMCKKFDFIIANPPYAIANEIISSVVKNVEYDTLVNLMPISDYKNKKSELFRYVDTCEQVSGEEFEDACINNVLCICELKKSKTNKYDTFDKLQMKMYDQKWIKYYQEQSIRKASWITKSMLSKKECLALDRDVTFALTVRTVVDGVHKTTNCFDWIYNNTNEDVTNHNTIKENKDGCVMIPWSVFKTETEKRNVCDFWYNSKIMTSIARGLHKQSLSNTTILLPKVDWSRPWTDEEILKEYGYNDEEIKEILK